MFEPDDLTKPVETPPAPAHEPEAGPVVDITSEPMPETNPVETPPPRAQERGAVPGGTIPSEPIPNPAAIAHATPAEEAAPAPEPEAAPAAEEAEPTHNEPEAGIENGAVAEPAPA